MVMIGQPLSSPHRDNLIAFFTLFTADRCMILIIDDGSVTLQLRQASIRAVPLLLDYIKRDR